MAVTLKKVVIALGAFALAGVLLLAGLIALLIRGDNAAKARATALCSPELVGTPMDVALARARASGAATREPQWQASGEGAARMVVAFPAWLPLTGYLCTVSAQDGMVAATELTTVD